MAQISNRNGAYKNKFGFPFIVAARMYRREGILFESNRRLRNDTQTEFADDRQNIDIIATFRLNKLCWARVKANALSFEAKPCL